MEEYNYEIKKILKNAEQEMFLLKHPYVGSEHLLLSLLKTECIQNICNGYGLTYDRFKKELLSVVGMASKRSSVILYTPLLRLILDNAITIAKNKEKKLDEKILFNALLTTDDGIAIRIMEYMDVDIEEIYDKLCHKDSEVLKNLGVTLEKSDILIGREKEISSIMKILLRKKKNNPILIGKAGVGKSALVYELARRINSGDVPLQLKNSKIISVDMATLLSNTKYRGEFESRINTIIEEVKNDKNIILFIDEIHTIVKSGSEQSLDAANILKPYLASDDIRVIGATTIGEYEKYIASDKALARRFEKIYVEEASRDEVINILMGVRFEYERFHGLKISDKNIYDIVTLADKYIFNNHNPDKSLDVLDYVCSKVKMERFNKNMELASLKYLKDKDYKKALNYKIKSKGSNKIYYQDILEVVENISNIRILKKEDYQKLIQTLDRKIYGQDLSTLKEILKKRFVVDKVLAILLRGHEGVGKSYTAKIIAEELKYNLIELDMEDYRVSTSINKLLGVDPGYIGYKDKCFLDEIKYQPYSLILLKNIDVADESVISLFKRIIKDGVIKDKSGDVVNFNNTLIIMTSNKIKKSVGYHDSIKEKEIIDNVVDYQLISKDAVKKYLENKHINIDELAKIKEFNSFKDVNTLIEDFLYTNAISVL